MLLLFVLLTWHQNNGIMAATSQATVTTCINNKNIKKKLDRHLWWDYSLLGRCRRRL